METVLEFTYIGDRVSAVVGCEAVTADSHPSQVLDVTADSHPNLVLDVAADSHPNQVVDVTADSHPIQVLDVTADSHPHPYVMICVMCSFFMFITTLHTMVSNGEIRHIPGVLQHLLPLL